MPLYEYYCRSCAVTFELLRPMSRSSEPARCPYGHAEGERTLSLFTAHTRDRGGAVATAEAGGGCAGCAGGACACAG